MKTFRVITVTGSDFEIEADFITCKTDNTQTRGTVFFWSKPHWYSRRCCVGMADWQVLVAALRKKVKSDAEIAKELGVKL